MKKKLQLLVLAFSVSLSSFAQSTRIWAQIGEVELSQHSDVKGVSFPASSLYFGMDLKTMTNILLTAPDVQTRQTNVTIEIPNTKGELETFKIWESSNFAPELQAAFPSIRAYTGIGVTDPSAYLRISLAPNGIQTMVLRGDKKAEFMEPCTLDGSVVALFNSRDRNENEGRFSCLTKSEQNLANNTAASITTLSNAQSMKKFRLALSCTGEYTAYFGGTVQNALAGMNATMTRVNGIYERDLAVKLEMIANTTSLIYTNATTDPYSPASTGSNGNWNMELQNNLTKTIGNAGYDIGHLFGASGGGGNAGCIGCVCSDSTTEVPQAKGSGFTSPGNSRPEGDIFDVDFVSHEMGHQLGAQHTFSSDAESGSEVQVEPGSGSTIMGYAGVTNYDIQKHSDPYFQFRSIVEIQNKLAQKSCQTDIPMVNFPPSVYAGTPYTIPKSTPFLLTGTGTDIDGDTILYNWEQNDNATTYGSSSFASSTKTTGPTFRSVSPGLQPTRYCPALNTILASTTDIPTETQYEALPSVARTLNFVLTGRDNRAGGGQTNSSSARITVVDTKGPFFLTSLNTDNISWAPGSTQIITWSVANTNTISGAANVDILLSTDNGQTYPTVLLANTPNDGSEMITVPDVTAPNCRLMVKASENIFFAINKKTFSIGYAVATNCTTPTKSTSTAIPSGATTFSTSTINVADSGTIGSISVSLDLTHSKIGELSFRLVSPQGTEIKLITNSCYSSYPSASKTIRFIDSGKIIDCTKALTNVDILPEQSLNSLIGEQASGTWTLKFMDNTAANSGTINSWKINLCTRTATPLGSEEFELKGLSLSPNPVNENLNISATQDMPEDYIVYNNLGQIIKKGKMNSTPDLSIDTSSLSSGVYFIKMNKDNASKTLKFLKK